MKHLKVLFTVVIAMFALTLSANAQNKDQKIKKEAEVTYSVAMHCQSCVDKLENKLPYIKGVKDLKISLEQQTIWFKYDPSKTTKEAIIKELEKLGYPAKEFTAKK